MRTRQKLTALGALTLAATAIGGGALVTSHAMADSSTPTKGTITVIRMDAGSDGAVQCTYDDIDLPEPSTGIGGAIAVSSSSTGPGVSSGGAPDGGPFFSTDSGTVLSPEGVDGDGPTLVIDGQPGDAPPPEGTITGSVTAIAGTAPAGTPGTAPDGVAGGPPADLPDIVTASQDARQGTAEECAAMQPTAADLPPAGATPASAAPASTTP